MKTCKTCDNCTVDELNGKPIGFCHVYNFFLDEEALDEYYENDECHNN